jgi:hypothetical protein
VALQGVVLPNNLPEYLDESNGESSLLSFVVHMWKEEEASEKQRISWRGHITAVPNGERHYFLDINEIPIFILSCLETQ